MSRAQVIQVMTGIITERPERPDLSMLSERELRNAAAYGLGVPEPLASECAQAVRAGFRVRS